MSLSQKHAGLILVPWFNADEWRHVYQLVYSNNKEKQVEALNLLKVWKMRTPILSTGVEGTLILLEVLVIDGDLLPDEHISNLYAIALMRFLNLSAANSDKQGSFTKMSAKNELPKWLTNLRHDIAHGHQIPSKYNLKMSLDFGFQWLKDKYWDPQSKIINGYIFNFFFDWNSSDYNIQEEAKFDDTLKNSLEIYIDININLWEKTDLDDEFYKNIKNVIYKKFKRKNLHPYLILEIFLEMITQSMEKNHSLKNVEQCLNTLVSTKALLKSNLNVVSEKEDDVKLNQKFVNIWTNLFNLLHRYGLLLSLVDRLFDAIGNINQSQCSKKKASMWINVIFISLQKLRKPDILIEDCYLSLEKNQYTYTEESLEFQKKVLYFSSEDSACYMTDFLDSLLRYNLSNDGFITDSVNLLKLSSTVENLHEAENKIYSLQDLVAEDIKMEDIEVTDPDEKDQHVSDNIIKNSKKIIGESKWKKIEDTSMFKNCPLGVLPHQINTRHPFLIMA